TSGLLYAKYYSKRKKLNVKIDADNGNILGNIYLLSEVSVFDKTGKKMAYIWPVGQIGKSQKAGMFLFENIEDDKYLEIKDKEIFKNKRGLNPPWENLKTPLVAMLNKKLKIFDRLSGKITREVDLSIAAPGLCGANGNYEYFSDSSITGDGKKILIPYYCEGMNKGLCIIVDLVEGKVITTIEIGKYPTNVVINK
ncbi:MAG: hypothetical protein V1752_08385, partial [Candidatus Firestonebacteria bacterium]